MQKPSECGGMAFCVCVGVNLHSREGSPRGKSQAVCEELAHGWLHPLPAPHKNAPPAGKKPLGMALVVLISVACRSVLILGDLHPSPTTGWQQETGHPFASKVCKIREPRLAAASFGVAQPHLLGEIKKKVHSPPPQGLFVSIFRNTFKTHV